MKNNILCGITGASVATLIAMADSYSWIKIIPLTWLILFLAVNYGEYVLEDLKEAIRE